MVLILSIDLLYRDVLILEQSRGSLALLIDLREVEVVVLPILLIACSLVEAVAPSHLGIDLGLYITLGWLLVVGVI